MKQRVIRTVFRYFLAVSMLCFLGGAAFAQAPEVLWIKAYGGSDADGFGDIHLAGDGGYFACGWTQSSGAGKADAWLVKTDSNGDVLWEKTYGGAQDDWAETAYPTADGGFIAVGGTNSFSAGRTDLWLLKTDANGDTLWARSYGGTNEEWGSAVRPTADGGYIVTGTTDSFGAGNDDVWLLRTDAHGDTLWTKTYGGALDDGDWFVALESTADGGFILATNTNSFGAAGVVSYDVWVLKTDADGDTTWTRTYGGPGHDGLDKVGVQQVTDGGYIFAGETRSFGPNPGISNAYLIRTDSAGDTLWTRAYGGDRGDRARAVHATSDDGFIVMGSSGLGADNTEVFLLKVDASGDTTWTMMVGGDDRENPWGSCLLPDGGYLVAGETRSFGAGDYDGHLIKTGSVVTGVRPESTPLQPRRFSLEQNHPNPFNPTTRISYRLASREHVTLKVFNIAGQEVATLVDGEQGVGEYHEHWKPAGLPSGVYVYRLQAGDFVEARKMLLVQ